MWGYLEYRGGCSVPWGDIMINVGGILSTAGAYLEYIGGNSVPCGDIMSTVGDTILCNLSTLGDIMIRVGDIMSTVGVLNKRFFPHGTEHPHGTHDLLHVHHDVPPRYSRYPLQY